jgi:hypothetical protein
LVIAKTFKHGQPLETGGQDRGLLETEAKGAFGVGISENASRPLKVQIECKCEVLNRRSKTLKTHQNTQ